MNRPISRELREILKGVTIRKEASNWTIKLEDQLEPKTYGHFKKALEVLSGRWDRGRALHVFMVNPKKMIEKILEDGCLPDMNPLDYFPTPENLVTEILSDPWAQEALLALKESNDPWAILEPEAGTGGLADHITTITGKPRRIQCVEKNPINCEVLRAKGYEPAEADFLTWGSKTLFDMVVMNPPFNGQEWKKHVEKAFTHLKEGGRLIAIVPSSLTSMEYAKELHEQCQRMGHVTANPADSFAEQGVTVRTVTIYAQKGYDHQEALATKILQIQTKFPRLTALKHTEDVYTTWMGTRHFMFPKAETAAEIFSSLEHWKTSEQSEGNVGTYCYSHNTDFGGSFTVRAHPHIEKAIVETRVIDDKGYFELVTHNTGYTVVYWKYNQILGDRLVAIVPTSSFHELLTGIRLQKAA